jgi:hypothetical protein
VGLVGFWLVPGHFYVGFYVFFMMKLADALVLIAFFGDCFECS